jgi:hypothetical protein
MISAFHIAESIIEIRGQDRKAYLHGQITQDLNLLNDNQFLWSGHCNAKGKLWSAHKLIESDDRYFLICGYDEATQTLAELKKYGVFSKSEFSTTEDYECIGLIADTTAEIEALLAIEFNEHNLAKLDKGFALCIAQGLVQLVIEPQYVEELAKSLTINSEESPWLAALIKAGLPRLNSQVFDEFVPQMINLQAINGISFSKGCYTGQETVARMKYLGKNKRAMFGLVGTDLNVTEANDIEMKLGDNWRRAGKVINQAQVDNQLYLQAVMPNDIAENAVLRIKNHDDSTLKLLPLPYSLED